MNISFDGMNQWMATFAAAGMAEGQVVKMTGSGAVDKCADGDVFCGVTAVAEDSFCGVQLGGVVTVPYTGGAPAVGYALLAANGSGGVKSVSTGGRSYLVLSVDTAAKTVTFVL